MNISKRRILTNAFFELQFSYCPLVWMWHSHANNSKINRLHEHCFLIIYSDIPSSFETLLEKDGFVSTHNRNLQILVNEMYEIKNDLPPLIATTEHFEQRNVQYYDLKNKTNFIIPPIRTVYHGSESIL